jgi:hypothetical protein
LVRFVVVCIPAFIFAGLLCRNYPPIGMALIGLGGAGLLLVSAAFSQWYWMG